MTEAYKKLIKTLQSMFEMDKADLDFGIYRIMNQKREEINRFLENDLLPQVKDAFASVGDDSKTELQKQLIAEIEQARKYGAPDPDNSPAVLEIKKKLENVVDSTALENEVFSKLQTFFSRYYEKGDFISQRRYKADTYAIPYQGEEIKLYWANHDQYYIKSSEHLKDYVFIAKDPSNKEKPFRIRLTEADIEKDNIKAKSNEERRFVINKECPLTIIDGELQINFQFIPVGKKKQDALNQEAIKLIFSIQEEKFLDWIKLLKEPTPQNKDRTILEKHLYEYTSRNTFDYFIHKNLEGFLLRELDFFIKNEVIHLDDIENVSISLTQSQINKAKTIRELASKIIRMLSHIEEFQKKLWLKKKVVTKSNYLISIDRIPIELLQEVLSCENQLKEWTNLFNVDYEEVTSYIKSTIKKEEFDESPLKFLVLDTEHFSEDFKIKLLVNIDNIDENKIGTIIKGDNFQILNFLQSKFKNGFDGVYLDPPYNTDASEIIYKNGYKNSSWASIIRDRLAYLKDLQKLDSALCITIDDFEKPILSLLLDDAYGAENHLATVAIRSNPQGRSTVQGFAINHEYGLFYRRSEKFKSVGRLDRTLKQISRYKETDENGNRFLWENFRKTGTDSRREDRKQQYYPLIVSGKTYRIPEMKWNKSAELWEYEESQLNENETFIFPVDENGNERVWKWGLTRVIENPTHIKVEIDSNNQPQLYRRNYLNIEGALPNTWWDKSKYAAGSHGTNLLTAMLGQGHSFPFPKSIFAVEDSLKIITGNKVDACILDIFGGSGTTAHAVINMNRLDNGKRKFVVGEMGEHYYDILLPRIKKAAYSYSWKGGKPVSPKESIDALKKQLKDLKEFSSNYFEDQSDIEMQCSFIKAQYEISQLEQKIQYLETYITENKNGLLGQSILIEKLELESYEDTLNNLQNVGLRTLPKGQQELIQDNPLLREDYFLSYWMDIDTGLRESLVTNEAFNDPFSIRMKISEKSVSNIKEINIDIITTFNYLIGLNVESFLKSENFISITGTKVRGEKALIIWRNLDRSNNTDLQKFCSKQKISPSDHEFDIIYINGDHTLDDPHSKVKLIETELKNLMFDVQVL